jgi:superfamily II DNA or RNA helicase
VITGNTKIKDDEKGIEQLRKTWGLIIWSLKKMYRGVDIPEIDNVIIASPVRFENTVIQSIWRALRKAEWKWDVQINVINDSILKNQRYEQAKVCREIYNISPEVIYFPK